MDLATFYDCLAQSHARGYDLNQEQKDAVEHNGCPLWLIAGPGSGKSEVLVTRTLRLLCVEPRIAPRSIILTTFTTKAARNLEDRLASYLLSLQAADPSLRDVDLADMRVGTLHSLCNDILQEFRYPAYQNVRLLDAVEQSLFTYRYADIANHSDLDFWLQFDHAVRDWRSKSFTPNKWKRTKAAVVLFDRIVEDQVDLQQMISNGGHWATLANFYQQYVQELERTYRCDFAHLQSRFYDFITSPSSQRFLQGDGQNRPPLLHVLVDEYQDTNPIQERIYLALANRPPYNLTVVGDDDQALYRFRGGTVTCMVNFDQACNAIFGVVPRQIQLRHNYRSHPRIVSFFNEYITSFPEMTTLGVRAPNKNPVISASSITGNYPAVSWLSARQAGGLAGAVAQFIQGSLVGDGIISDLSQCVLLLRSTKDSPKNAGPYITAFQDLNIPVYNPRSKSFMESQEVQCLLGALIRVVDMNSTYASMRDQRGQPQAFVGTVQSWIDSLTTINNDPAILTQSLFNYITQSKVSLVQTCASQPNDFINLNLLEILYRILSLEPFRSWKCDPVQNLRLSKVTRLFESYQSFNLGDLRANAAGTEIDPAFLNSFYFIFVSYLIEAGIDDDEDEDVTVPRGYLPIMTIHQSKGLEFPFVFVAQLGQKGWGSSAQILERDLTPFRQDLYPRISRSPDQLSVEDDIRLLYVAYSRAQYGLVLVGTRTQIASHVAAPRRDAVAFRRNIQVI